MIIIKKKNTRGYSGNGYLIQSNILIHQSKNGMKDERGGKAVVNVRYVMKKNKKWRGMNGTVACVKGDSNEKRGKEWKAGNGDSGDGDDRTGNRRNAQ